MKLWTLALILSTPALAQDTVVKIFSDKGNFFVRADPKHAVAVGAELAITSDAAGAKAAGTAIVMEVTGQLARISLDDDATKSATRFARLPDAKGGSAAPAPVAVAAAPLSAPPAPPAPSGPQLKGHLDNGALRVTAINESDNDWSDCELRFDDGRYYKLGELASHSEDTVITLKFSRPPSPPEPIYDHVLVVCDEGETKFMFNNPHSPGQLKGYAENEGGRVTIHNASDNMWTRCDVRKPDKSHYVLEKLKPKDQDSIRSGAFVKEKEFVFTATLLSLNCKQGNLQLKLK